MISSRSLITILALSATATVTNAQVCPVDGYPVNLPDLSAQDVLYGDAPNCVGFGTSPGGCEYGKNAPVQTDKNPQCDDFGYSVGYKFNTQCPDTNGEFVSLRNYYNVGSCPDYDDCKVKIECMDGGTRAKIEFEQNCPLVVKIKAGPGGFIYNPTSTSGEFYHMGDEKGISHIEFCGQCNCDDDDSSSTTTTTTSSTSQGDPHMKTWNGTWFDYMGMCDLKFAHVTKFDGANDLDIDIRTTIQDDWSYIESAAVRIGEDIFEVSSYGEYSINGVGSGLVDSTSQPSLRGSVPVAHIGGYPIHHRWEDKQHFKHTFDIILDENENITIANVKQLVGVTVNHADEKHFKNVVGVLGNIKGELLARDGVTHMERDTNAFVQEWQIRDTDPMLFSTVREPQYPNLCVLPDASARESRRLSEGISEDEAEVACAHLKSDEHAFANCVYDVTATNDLDMAGAF